MKVERSQYFRIDWVDDNYGVLSSVDAEGTAIKSRLLIGEWADSIANAMREVVE